MSELILSVEDLTVSFDGFKAVDGFNFYVEKDELRCVIGPMAPARPRCST